MKRGATVMVVSVLLALMLPLVTVRVNNFFGKNAPLAEGVLVAEDPAPPFPPSGVLAA